MRETIRVLLGHNECEIHQGYVPGEAGRWNYLTSGNLPGQSRAYIVTSFFIRIGDRKRGI